MGSPLPASAPITHLLNVLAFVQLANKNGDIKKITQKVTTMVISI
jgi:hypothetical protein